MGRFTSLVTIGNQVRTVTGLVVSPIVFAALAVVTYKSVQRHLEVKFISLLLVLLIINVS